jgi:hypothetical protein
VRGERLVLVAGVLALALSVQPRARSAEPDRFQADARPLLKKYCFACHGEQRQEAEIDLSVFPDEASLAKGQELWLTVVEVLRGYTMPPPKEPQPGQAEREQLLAILTAAMDRIDESRPPRAGLAPLRRLNRVEYQNTLRDLLGIDLALTDDLPADDTAHGFDNVADALSISPLLMEKYLNAAERALDKVVITDTDVILLERQLAGSELRRGNRPDPRAGSGDPDRRPRVGRIPVARQRLAHLHDRRPGDAGAQGRWRRRQGLDDRWHKRRAHHA